MKLRPLHDRLIVKRLDGEEKTAGGLFIPDTAKEKPQKGKIMAVGNGKKPRTARSSSWMSRWAIPSCSASMPAPRSRWMATSC